MSLQACAQPVPEAAGASDSGVRGTNVINIPEAGDIPHQSLRRVVPQIAELRAQPQRVSLRAGEGFRVSDLKILAYDASGKLLGRLKQTDRDIQPRDVLAMPNADVVQGRKPGVGQLKLFAPLWAELGAGKPQPAVLIEVDVGE